MKARDVETGSVSGYIFGFDFIEREGGGVDQPGIFRAPAEQFLGDDRTGIKADGATA